MQVVFGDLPPRPPFGPPAFNKAERSGNQPSIDTVRELRLLKTKETRSLTPAYDLVRVILVHRWRTLLSIRRVPATDQAHCLVRLVPDWSDWTVSEGCAAKLFWVHRVFGSPSPRFQSLGVPLEFFIGFPRQCFIALP
jgi:hypothetical protein